MFPKSKKCGVERAYNTFGLLENVWVCGPRSEKFIPIHMFIK